jgi:sn-glycerol 3-phosphate transport system substrate-binding protein
MNDFSRRDFLFGAAATTAATIGLGLTGGGAASAASSKKPAKNPSAKNKYSGVKAASQITFWSSHPAKSKPIEEELIRRFNAANPDIKVVLQTAGANYAEIAQKFNAGLAAKSVPDVVMLSDVWWFKFYLNRSITPLDELFANEKVDVADYNKTLLADYQFAGQQWAVPFNRSTPLFYYNKSLWSAAGLPDRAPETWAEFETWTPKLQEKIGGGKFPFTLVKGDSYIAWTFQNLLWGQGGAYSTNDFKLTLDTSEAIAAGQFLREQVSVKKYANVTSNSETDDFLGGLTASVVSSTGGLSGVLSGAKGKFEVGTGFLPKGPKSGSVCPTGGAGLAIPALVPADRKVAAMRFLNFITSPESTAYYSANVGYMPVRTSAIEGATMTQVYKDKPQFRTAVDQLPKTRSQDTARVFVPGGDAILGKALEAMVLSNSDPKAAWATAADQLQKIIETDVKPGL